LAHNWAKRVSFCSICFVLAGEVIYFCTIECGPHTTLGPTPPKSCCQTSQSLLSLVANLIPLLSPSLQPTSNSPRLQPFSARYSTAPLSGVVS
jgi:hypothetical protein